MVNEEHYARLKKSVQDWNKWRVKNLNLRGMIPDLGSANLSEADLSGADLSRAYLYKADLSGAIFYKADLGRADLGSANLSGAYLYKADLSGADLGSANLSEADLSGADLHEATLLWADLSGAILGGANLSGAILSGSDLSRAYLRGSDLSRAYLYEANLRGTILYEANLRGVNLLDHDLSGADLSGADLSGADLSGADLSRADLSRADLSGANLSKTQALGTDFTSAKFTGACLEDWNINSATKLDNIDCQYVYLRNGKEERRPSSGEFAPGEFTKLFQKALETVDLIFRNGVDWEAFAYSFRKIQVENESSELAIQSLELKGDGLVVRVNVSPSADKAKIHSDFIQGYEFAHKVLEERYRAELSGKDTQIVRYSEEVQKQREYINNLFKLLSQQQTVQKAMAENPKKVSNTNFYNPQFAGGFVDANTVDAHQIGGNIANYTPEQRQTLAEAAAEIQQLLYQLSQTTSTNQDAVTEAIHQEIKRNPTLKARLITALKAGGLEALKAIFNHPLFSIPAETIKGWLEAE